MKRICVITTTHPAEDNRIYLREIESLLTKYEVKYVTTNKIKEKKKNLTVIPLGSYQKGVLRRIGRAVSAYNAAKKSDADVIHFHEFDFLFWAFFLKLFHKKKIIYDVHEDYPSLALEREYIPVFLRSFFSFLIRFEESLFGRYFSGIITVTEELRKRMVHHNKNTVVVANYPAKKYFEKYNPKKYSSKKNFVIAHLGNLYRARGAEVIAGGIGNTKNTSLLVIGDIYPPSLREELMASYPGKLKTTGNKNYKEALKLASECDLGIIGYLPYDNQITCSPNKLFEYMGLSLPVIASDLPVFLEILNKTKSGVTYESQNSESLSGKILEMTKDPDKLLEYSKKSKESFALYNWESEEIKLLEFYEKII